MTPGDLDQTTVIPAVAAGSASVGPRIVARPAGLAESVPVSVTCPSCGTPGMVDPARRDATGFCGHCDFPLFWSRDQVVVGGPVDAGDDSLKRLPGAVGRVVIGSVPCPHCNELNPPSAVYCVRCGLAMQFTPPPPSPPVPVQLPAPEPHRPAPEPEPERLWIWWVVLIAVFVLSGVALVWAQHWY